MATKAEVMRILRHVKGGCKPKITTKENGWLMRDTCILHKYLNITKENGYIANSFGCLGGDICNELQHILGVKHSNACPRVHSNIYNLVKSREIRI